jgi:hypothetical protein
MIDYLNANIQRESFQKRSSAVVETQYTLPYWHGVLSRLICDCKIKVSISQKRS